MVAAVAPAAAANGSPDGVGMIAAEKAWVRANDRGAGRGLMAMRAAEETGSPGPMAAERSEIDRCASGGKARGSLTSSVLSKSVRMKRTMSPPKKGESAKVGRKMPAPPTERTAA